MAKKQITSRSSFSEIKTANEQLRAAEVEYKDVVSKWPKASDYGLATGANDYYINPTNNSPMTVSNWSTVKSNIAAKYDYVDYGQAPQPTYQSGQPTEINIGNDQFFVNGLGSDTKTTFDSRDSQTIATDDAYRAPTTVQSNVNQPGNNPNAAKVNQDAATAASGQTAIQSPGVTPDNQVNTTTQKELSQAEKAVATQEQTQTNNTGTGVVNTNPNTVPTTAANGSQLNNPQQSSTDKAIGQTDDAGTIPKGQIGRGSNTTNAEGVTNAIDATPDPGRTGNGGTTIGTNQSIKVVPQSAGTPNNPNVEVRPNILHNYVNWTYKIGLYMLGADVYNEIVKSGDIIPKAKEHPIAVSGGYKREAAAGNLEGDIYIEELRFTSIIGNRQAGAGTNNIDLEMTLVEPYGARLIGELLILGGAINKNMTLAEIPYLLEIDFTGYQDDGTPIPSILKDGKKYIPVKIIGMDMKLESAGARYTLQMVPYSLFALSSRYAVAIKGGMCIGETVEQILGEGETGLIGRINRNEISIVQEDKTQEFNDTYKIKFYSFSKDGTGIDDLKNAKVAHPVEGGTATATPNRAMAMGAAMGSFSPTQHQTYSIHGNTLIVKAIIDLILASEYFPQKMSPQDFEAQKSKPAELIKVIPQIEIDSSKWDTLRNEHPKIITFHVMNTLLWGENFPSAGNAPVGDWGYSKIYNYLFTGKNDDIINCDVNFNLVYYNKITPDRKATSIIRTDTIGASYELATKVATQVERIANASTKTTTTAKTSPSDQYRYINATLASDFFDLKMNNSAGDMITLDLEIIGDPEWIPQDASVRGGSFSIADFKTKLDKHGSIGIDVAGVYVKLQLKSPRDYNDAKGTMDINKDQSMVGGVYQVISVQNMFAGGKFTSILNMVKIPNQEENEKPTPSTSATGPGGMFG